MKIALAQINTTVGDIFGNRDRAIREMERARTSGADLVVFPELCLTGYPPRDLMGLHGFVDSNLEALRQIAAHTGGLGAVIGFVDRNRRDRGRDFHNAAAFIAEGEIRAVIHKTLLPSYDVFDEDRYFEPADRLQLVPFRGRTLGISICEDAWNGEDFWPRPLHASNPVRDQVEQGADLLINIAASPYEMTKLKIRHQMLKNHALRSGVPLVYVNLVGGNDDLLFDGTSLVIGSAGNLVARGKRFSEDLVIADPDSENDLPLGEVEGEAIRPETVAAYDRAAIPSPQAVQRQPNTVVGHHVVQAGDVHDRAFYHAATARRATSSSRTSSSPC